MNLHDFYYDLPQELIAQDPLEDRIQFQTDGTGSGNRTYRTPYFS